MSLRVNLKCGSYFKLVSRSGFGEEGSREPEAGSRKSGAGSRKSKAGSLRLRSRATADRGSRKEKK